MKNSHNPISDAILIRKWIKDNHCESYAGFDFKNKHIIFYDGGFVSIKRKIKIHRKRRKSKFGQDFKIEKFACTFYFGSLDETINYLVKTRNFLNKMGFETSTVHNRNPQPQHL